MTVTAESLIVTGGRRGRPPISGSKATERIEFVVTPEQRDDLQEVADGEGKKLAGLIRDAVDEYVSDFRERRVFRR